MQLADLWRSPTQEIKMLYASLSTMHGQIHVRSVETTLRDAIGRAITRWPTNAVSCTMIARKCSNQN